MKIINLDGYQLVIEYGSVSFENKVQYILIDCDFITFFNSFGNEIGNLSTEYYSVEVLANVVIVRYIGR